MTDPGRLPPAPAEPLVTSPPSLRAPELRADGLVLGPWRDSDAAVVLAIADDPDTRAWSPSMRPLRTISDARAWMHRRMTNEGRVDWAVRDAASGVLVGRVGLHRFEREPQVDARSAEIGYGVHPAHRRRAVARRAVQIATQHGFDVLGLHRISLIHATGNTASCAVAASSGYRFEGVEREVLDHGDGVLHDVHRHARLRSDAPGAVPRPPDPCLAPDPVEIAAGRLQLRPPSEADAADTLLMLRDPDVRRWNPSPETLDLEGARAWCRRGAAWSDGPHATFSVLDAVSGRLLGNVSLHKLDLAQRDAEIGYRVAPWARGAGVGSDAVAAASRWAFGALGLLRIELCHAVVNLPSCRVAVKAGYLLEGTLRQAYVYGDGKRYDEHVHARLASDPDPVS
jgi:RimJ/RimL family protein N-acetyltransferase